MARTWTALGCRVDRVGADPGRPGRLVVSRTTEEIWAERARKYWESDAAPRTKQPLRYVRCGDCRHYAGKSPCDAGFHTSGDPPGYGAVRICDAHDAKGAQNG